MTKIKENKMVIANIIAIILISIFCISVAPVSLQNDTYYTIKIGEHILQNGIDMKDSFSWHNNLPYTYPHWLYDLITYLIYSFSGFKGIYITTCILSIILGMSIYFVNCKLAKNRIISFFITIGSMYMLRNFIAARAQLLTFILFIFTIYFIEMFLEKKQKRYVIPLIIIPILIANLHTAVWPFYFILYLPYIGEYIISVLLDLIYYNKIKHFLLEKKIKKLSQKNKIEKINVLQEKLQNLNEKINNEKIKREEKKNNAYKIEIKQNKNVKFLIFIMLICVLTGLITPIKDTPYTYLIKTMQGNTTKNINEHLPMTIVNHSDILCTIIIFLSLLTFTKAKLRLKDLFMLGGLVYLMLLSKRQASMFILICGIILNRLIINLLSKYKNINMEIKTYNNKLLYVAVVLFVLTISVGVAITKKDDKIVDEKTYPVKASEWILNNLDLENLRMYNEYNFGSYLLFKGIPVFIDSRADLYAPEFNTKTGKAEDGKDIFSDYLDFFNISKFYGNLIEEYNMTHMILYKNSKINMLIENIGGGEFTLIYSDDNFVIYEIVK